jgi:ABC-type nickel/cobalt efflux system permease component RcnA
VTSRGAPGRKPSRLERAEWFFTFLVFFAGFFYLTREATTDLQWYFRVVSIYVGVAGWMVVQVLKRRRR